MKSAGPTLKLKTFFFSIDVIEYLEHTLRPETLEVVKNTTVVRRDIRTPTNISGLNSFLELCNVYGLVPIFLEIDATLNAKLKRGHTKSFELDKTELVVIEQMEEQLTTPPIIQLSQNEKNSLSLT